MSKRIFNVVRPREYQSGNETKTAWDQHGVLIVDGDKISIRLQSLPLGEWNGWLNVFPREEKDNNNERRGGSSSEEHRRASGRGAAPAKQPDFDDDIPF